MPIMKNNSAVISEKDSIRTEEKQNQRTFLQRILRVYHHSFNFNSKPVSGKDGIERLAPLILLAAVILFCLLPFVNKAFHIDDPLFIWAAKNIQSNPSNPYAFNVNWYGAPMPMSSVTKNPPLASYCIALSASLMGWSEIALHCTFLLFALAAAIGIYFIAQRFCKHPLIATLAGVLTPVFFVSSLTVMSDVMMLAFWVFAIHFWIEGLENRNHAFMALAGLLIAFSALTKYFAITLIPLLLIYSIFKERRMRWHLLYFLIPIIILAWYQWTTQHLYGRGLLFDAAAYEFETQFSKAFGSKTYVGLAFTGGCIASVLFFSRQMWSQLAILTGITFAAITTLIIFTSKTIGSFSLPTDTTAHWLIAIQLALWGTTGISLILLSAIDFFRNRDADSLLLSLWVIGTFIFAGFINWSTNGRSILPMIVPAGILMVRRIEQQPRAKKQWGFSGSIIPLVFSALLSLAVTYADSQLANSARLGATRICGQYQDNNRTIWFQGHWGYQYYMEQLNAKTISLNDWSFIQGDIIAVPTTNYQRFEMPDEWIKFREEIDIPLTSWLATMNGEVGAGFYADVFGPLPFAFGNVKMERFEIYDVKPRIVNQ